MENNALRHPLRFLGHRLAYLGVAILVGAAFMFVVELFATVFG